MSSSHERKVKAYLTPKNDIFFDGYVKVEEVSRSEAVNIMIKYFFQSLTEDQRKKYLEQGKSV